MKTKKLLLYKPEQRLYAIIYFKYLIGYTYREIIRILRSEALSHRIKRLQRVVCRHRPLKHTGTEKYMGDVILQKTYTRDFLSERRVLNTGQAPQKYVENNHPAIIDRTTWNAVQAEMERRANLRTVEKSGKGRYSGQYAFSGKIECGCCGAGYRRHHQHGNRAWVCKQHIKKSSLCPALPIRENVLEAAFVRTLNDIIQNHDRIIEVVGTAVNEALAEAGEELDRNDEVVRGRRRIETLQARIWTKQTAWQARD